MDKLFFMPFERIDDLVEPVYKIERSMLGNECFVLDSLNLAAILADDDKELTALRDNLPPWTLVLCLSGGHRLPEEKIEYEEEALQEIALKLNFEALTSLPGVPGLQKKLLPMLRKPWAKDGYWRLRYKGSWHGIFFHTTLNRVPEFTKAMHEVAVKYGYPTRDIDFYLQPIERARICYCQYGLHCELEDAKDVVRVRSLYLEASERVVSMGGLFTTPYGPWADMVYSRTATYTAALKVAKDVLDPNKILNPGKLCF
jgi:hypothetical protein